MGKCASKFIDVLNLKLDVISENSKVKVPLLRRRL
jgi:hypothetical protein